jgi:hypothetical protein
MSAIRRQRTLHEISPPIAPYCRSFSSVTLSLSKGDAGPLLGRALAGFANHAHERFLLGP